MTGFQQQELRKIYSMLDIIENSYSYYIIIQTFVLCIKQQNTHLFEKQRLGKDHRGVTKFNRSNSSNDMKA